MSSKLIIVPVEKLQYEVSCRLKSQKGFGIYVSLNKTKKSLIKNLNKEKINTEKLFFIDCVSSDEESEEDIKIKPNELDKVLYGIKCFIKETKEERFLFIDSLVTLLLYNNVDKVARFIETLTIYASKYDVNLIAISQKTSEDLLNKIYNFFDKVEK